jgi:hypothetical protein
MSGAIPAIPICLHGMVLSLKKSTRTILHLPLPLKLSKNHVILQKTDRPCKLFYIYTVKMYTMVCVTPS